MTERFFHLTPEEQQLAYQRHIAEREEKERQAEMLKRAENRINPLIDLRTIIASHPDLASLAMDPETARAFEVLDENQIAEGEGQVDG